MSKETPKDDPFVAAAFLHEFLKDLGTGQSGTLLHYQRLFAGHEGLIEREYAAITREGSLREHSQIVEKHAPWVQQAMSRKDPLTPGQTLSSYEILAPLGAGGMGLVYRARDTKLDRVVAIKVLPTEMASQPERVERFEREAKAVAALDHPNIVTIHSVERSEGLHFITMQLVEGKTLSELIPRRGFSLEKFFELTIPLADALSAAHQQGITHRDLKPANVMVTDEGRVEILDFGLAKLREDIACEHASPQANEPLTEEGKIIGTVAYMSPEQAEGKDVDHRTDIFSLGIIFYEMITGERPFKGQTNVALMSSIMKDTPIAVHGLNPRVPNDLGRIIRRSLEKDPERRFQSSKDLRNELTDLKKEIDSGETVVPLHQPAGHRLLWPAVSGALVVALLLVLLVPRAVPDVEDGGPQFTHSLQLTDSSGVARWPSLAADGKEFLYESGGDIYSQLVGGTRPWRLIENSLHAARDATGDRIAFARPGGGIYVSKGRGEQAWRVSDKGFDPSWSPDGKKLVYTTEFVPDVFTRRGHGDLWIVDIETQQNEPLFQDTDVDAFDPSWSPRDRWIAFCFRRGSQRDIYIIDPRKGEPLAITDDAHFDWGPMWSPEENCLYFISDRGRKPDLWSIAIDPESGETLGKPREAFSSPYGRVIQASISDDGSRIVCSLESWTSVIVEVAFDPEIGQLVDGEERVLKVWNNDRLIDMSLSPHGQWLAYQTYAGVQDIGVIHTDSGEELRVTDDAFIDRDADWYPDDSGGLILTFRSNRPPGPGNNFFAVPVPQGGNPLPVFHGPNLNAAHWSPDDRLYVHKGMVYEFSNGLFGGASAQDPAEEIYATASWSRRGPDRRAGRLVAQIPFGELHGPISVFSEDGSVEPQNVEGPDGSTVDAGYQSGSRWLDDHRFILWDRNLKSALLWDTDRKQAKEIAISRYAEFLFSEDGTKLYMLRTRNKSDLWMLELDPESIR